MGGVDPALAVGGTVVGGHVPAQSGPDTGVGGVDPALSGEQTMGVVLIQHWGMFRLVAQV